MDDRLEELERKISEDPGSPAFVELADSLYRKGWLSRATQVVLRGCEENPNRPYGWLIRAILAIECQEWDDARHSIRKLELFGLWKHAQELAPKTYSFPSTPHPPKHDKEPIEPAYVHLLPERYDRDLDRGFSELRSMVDQEAAKVLTRFGASVSTDYNSPVGPLPSWLADALEPLGVGGLVRRASGARHLLNRERWPERTTDPKWSFGELRHIGAIECASPERCSVALDQTHMGWISTFVRELPQADVDSTALACLNYWFLVREEHLAKPTRIERLGDKVRAGFEYVPGASLADIDTLPPQLALMLLYDAQCGLHALHSLGMTHGSIRDTRVRIRLDGRAVLCYGLDPQPVTAASERNQLARLFVSRAFDDSVLLDILSTPEEGALEVASDRIIEQRPELAPLVGASMNFKGSGGEPPKLDVGWREACAFLLALYKATLKGTPSLPKH